MKSSGIEISPEGQEIGRDPREMTPDELKKLGHVRKPVLQAIRERCVDCSGGSVNEVRLCPAVACAAWPFRMGTDPWRVKRVMTEEEKSALRHRLETGRKQRLEASEQKGRVTK